MRIGMLQAQFGPSMAPKGHQTRIMQTVCEKYQCETDKTKLLRIMTLSTAIWALQSLAAKDDGIRKTLSDVFQIDPRLKGLYEAERTASGNYFAAVTFVTVLGNGRSDAEQDQAFAAMSKAAVIYGHSVPRMLCTRRWHRTGRYSQSV